MPLKKYKNDEDLRDYRSFRENGKKVLEHRRLAELALGGPLPEKAEIHHLTDFRDNSNIMICQDRAHHMWIHYRQRAFDASGNANWLKCGFCKEYDDPENGMSWQRRPNGKGFRAWHRRCATEHKKTVRC